MIPNKESQAEAIIEKKTRLIVVEADRLRSWMDRFPTWRKFILNLYYNRLAELMTLVDLVLFKSMERDQFISLERGKVKIIKPL